MYSLLRLTGFGTFSPYTYCTFHIFFAVLSAIELMVNI